LRLNSRPGAHQSRSLVLLGALAIVSIFASFFIGNPGRWFSPRGANASELENRKLSRSLLERRRVEEREIYQASRQGFQFGIPKQAMVHAAANMRAMMARQRGASAAAIAGGDGELSAPAAALSGTWSSIGPVPMSEAANFTGVTVGSNVMMTGRITAVAADSTGLIVAGAASGGLWLSTNNGTTFTSIFDGQPTQAIGALALDTTTTPSTIYVGTGEGNGSIDSLYGSGIFKSANLGQTWTSLDPTGIFDHAAFTSLAIDTSTTPGTPRIFAGTTNGFSANRADAGIFETDSSVAGLWFSANGGTSWTQYPESTFGNCDLVGDGTAPCPADDVKVDPNNAQNVYVAIDSNAIYVSNNGGKSFKAAIFPGTKVTQGRQSLTIGPKVGIPLGPNNPTGGAVYVMIGAADGVEYAAMYQSFDSGMTWDAGSVLSPTIPSFTANGVTLDGTSSSNFSQSSYDQALLVTPTDASTVFFGGVGLYKSFGNYGHSWTFLAPNGGIHDDFHALTWDPANNQILAGTDGGLYMFNPATSSPTFISLNQNINAGQIQGIGPHPTNAGQLIAGFQDNGTQLYSGSVSGWVAPNSETGDGGFAFYDANDPTFLYHDFSLDDLDGALISASSNGGQTWCSTPNSSISACNVRDQEWTPALVNLINTADDPGPVFYPPLAVDPSVAHRVWFGAHSVYVSTDGMAHWAQQTDQDLTADGTIEGSACADQSCALEDLEFGPLDGKNGHPAWALAMSNLTGTVEFEVSNTTQANVQLGGANAQGGLWSDVTAAINTVLKTTSPLGALSTQATSIAPDPHNSNVAYLGLSGFTADTQVGHIYKTVNFGQTWTEADGGLPDVPVLKVLVDANDDSGTCGTSACSNSILAGTDIGIFHSSDGGLSWQPFNSGLLTVPVYDLAQNSSGVTFAGTHGRGVFQLTSATVTATPTATPTTTTTATPTVSPSPTPTPTATATATMTPTVTATSTAAATATPTPIPTLTPTPVPSGARVAAPGAVNMSAVGLGQSTTHTFSIKNSGKGNLVGTIQVVINPPSRASVFTVTPGSFNLAPGQSQAETVVFTPDGPIDSAAAIISTNDSTRPTIGVTLNGSGAAGKLSVAKTFTMTAPANGTTQVNLTIKNTGKGLLSGDWVPVATPPYSVAGNSFALQPNATANIAIIFSPTAKGTAPSVVLPIEILGPGTSSTAVTLKGVGN